MAGRKLDKVSALEKKATQILKQSDTEPVGLGHLLVTLQRKPLVRLTVKSDEAIPMIVEGILRLNPGGQVMTLA